MRLLNWISPSQRRSGAIQIASHRAVREAQEKLRQSEERYRAIVESQTDLVIRINANGEFTFVNDAYCRKVERKPEELIGKTFTPYVHPDDLKHVESFVQSLAQAPYRGFLEHRSWFNGEWRLTLWEGYAIRNKQNRIIEFQGVGRDITEQRKTQSALRESEQRFRAAFENSPIAQCIVGLDGKILKVNPAATEALGYSPEEFSKLSFLDFTFEEDKNKGVQALEDLRSGRLNTYRTEKRYLHKSGRIVWSILATSVIRNDAGKPLYLVSQIIDISDRMEQEEILRHHAEELGRSNLELAQFAHVVSHDIREPLRMITNFIELLIERMQKQMDATSQEYAHYALDGAKRAQDLIHDLLSFAKLNRPDDLEINIDLNDIIQKCKLALNPIIEKTHASIHSLNLPKQIPGSETRFIQVFQNLLDNSVKYRSKAAPRICIVAQERHTDWLIYLEDNGIGIPEEYRDRVFKMFQRLHARREFSGTGMGLAIVKKIIESRGGRIWIESTKTGEGTRFAFTWPKVRVKSLRQRADEVSQISSPGVQE